VFSAPQLLASATRDRVTNLLGTILIEDATSHVADLAPMASRLLDELENALRPAWESEIQGQRARAITHKRGDFLWRHNVGWAVCLEDVHDNTGQPIKVRLKGIETAVMAGFYVNVSDACGRDPALDRLVQDLRRAVAIPARTGEQGRRRPR
jgi:hypothetical protein